MSLETCIRCKLCHRYIKNRTLFNQHLQDEHPDALDAFENNGGSVDKPGDGDDNRSVINDSDEDLSRLKKSRTAVRKPRWSYTETDGSAEGEGFDSEVSGSDESTCEYCGKAFKYAHSRLRHLKNSKLYHSVR